MGRIFVKKEEITKINQLLVDRPDLKVNLLYIRSYLEVKAILEMPEWKEERFKGLLVSSIWNSSVADIKEVLSMPEWENERYKLLLTSTIWNNSVANIKGVLNMPEWKEEKFEGLLTPNIWNSSKQDVSKKLGLEYWNDPRYRHLLMPSIFNDKLKNIKEGIELLEEYGISSYITNRCLRRNQKQQRVLIEYLVQEGIDLVVEDKNGIDKKLHPILSVSNTVLKEKYNIDIHTIMTEKVAKKHG